MIVHYNITFNKLNYLAIFKPQQKILNVAIKSIFFNKSVTAMSVILKQVSQVLHCPVSFAVTQHCLALLVIA